MTDERPVSYYNIQDQGFVVVMVSKAKATASAPKPTAATTTSEGAVSTPLSFFLLALLLRALPYYLLCVEHTNEGVVVYVTITH